MRTTAERIAAFDNIVGIKNSIMPETMYYRMLSEGYFTAPASMSHHGNYVGGLYDHSEMVALTLLSFTKRLELKWEREESPYLIGFLHDFCKVDEYVIGPEGEYHYNGETMLCGHGDKSAILAMRDIRLTDEELMCIRYHQGAYEGSEVWKNLGAAIRKYPNILWTHTADMYASQIVGV
uniref:hypothetical protein n=1 Tax=Eisenbergiella sp. TaxID=1924109 RepID=UPI003AB7CC4A